MTNPMSSESGTIPLAGRLVATIFAGALWFAFVVLYLAFYAADLDFWQKAAVFLASGALVGAIIASLWVTYGFVSTTSVKEPQHDRRRQSRTNPSRGLGHANLHALMRRLRNGIYQKQTQPNRQDHGRSD